MKNTIIVLIFKQYFPIYRDFVASGFFIDVIRVSMIDVSRVLRQFSLQDSLR